MLKTERLVIKPFEPEEDLEYRGKSFRCVYYGIEKE